MNKTDVLPTTLKGKRVLVIGDSDMAFEAGKRDAKSVVLLVQQRNEALEQERAKRESTVELKQGDIMDLMSWNIGQFELVVVYNVLEHLPQPLNGLERAASVATPSGKIIVETAVRFNDSTIPQFVFEENKYYPNYAWLKREFSRLGFKHIMQLSEADGRIVIQGER